jgi:predicted O-methyltransferase YrrM
MSASVIELDFFQFFLRAMNAAKVLEIGTFLGVSAMYFAEALPTNGKVTTIEKYDLFAEIARKNISDNGLDKKIDVVVGDALSLLDGLTGDQEFDFVFIDGNKENYARYFEIVAPHVRLGGVVAIDDALFFGDCLNARPQTAKGVGVRQALEVGSGFEGWEALLLPIYNGLYLLQRHS